MIVVRIQLWKKGNEADQQELATLAIGNIGGDKREGKYAYAVSHQNGSGYAYERDPHKLLRPLDSDGKKTCVPIWKQGVIRDFRKADGVVKLLVAVLFAAFKPGVSL